jgi:hypothetical protein
MLHGGVWVDGSSMSLVLLPLLLNVMPCMHWSVVSIHFSQLN